jgi:hypothetical protein
VSIGNAESSTWVALMHRPGPAAPAEDDVSVATGFFTVTVRPWQVVMQGQP